LRRKKLRASHARHHLYTRWERGLSWDLHKLFKSHASEIARALRRRGFNPDTAADLTQDTFVRALALGPQKTAEVHNPRAYLHQVSRHLSINHVRRENLIGVVTLDDAACSEIPDPVPNAEKIVCDRQTLKLTAAALAELPEKTRRAFELHRLGEHTLAEVGEKIGLSTARTWALVHEAYRHLVLRTGGL